MGMGRPFPPFIDHLLTLSAMAQASKLFDSQSAQGNVASGASKESAVQKAGEMALKMYMQSQGGSSGGGMGSLMGMASKFF